MKKHIAPEASLGFEELSRELLGLDPVALMAMDPKRVSAAAGLHQVLRFAIEQALGLLRARNGTLVRLRADARDIGWDTKSWNLANILAYAMVCEPRRQRGLPRLRLCHADDRIVDLPRQRDTAEPKTPTSDLAVVAITLLREGMPAPGTIDADIETASLCALIKDALEVSPQDLLRPHYASDLDVAEAMARDPDGQVAAALGAFMISLLDAFVVADAAEGDMIRLLLATERRADNEGLAKLGNLATLFIGALLVDGERDVAFITKVASSLPTRCGGIA